MNFIQSVRTCFRKYANFKGRAMRSEFWWFQFLVVVGSIVTLTLDHLLLGYAFENTVTPFVTLISIAMLVPSASVVARRLHDIGWSGWVQLPVFLTYMSYLDVWFPDFSLSTVGTMIMGAGFLYWLVLLLILIKDSQGKTNKYGPNPKSPEMGEIFS